MHNAGQFVQSFLSQPKGLGVLVATTSFKKQTHPHQHQPPFWTGSRPRQDVAHTARMRWQELRQNWTGETGRPGPQVLAEQQKQQQLSALPPVAIASAQIIGSHSDTMRGNMLISRSAPPPHQYRMGDSRPPRQGVWWCGCGLERRGGP